MQLPLNTPQFFFDDTLIAYQQRLVRRWLPAKVFPKPVIEPEYPWEGRQATLYGTILPEADGYRMYYTNFRPGHGSDIFLATSKDGLRWEKPELGIVEYDGRTANNLVLLTEWHLDSPSVVYDAGDPEYPYKMLLFHAGDPKDGWGETWGLFTYRSRDGLRWEMAPGRRLKAGDRTNVMSEQVDGRFRAYTRHPQMGNLVGGRAVYLSESPDFLAWTEPELVLKPDLDDETDIEFYGMSVFQRHGWYIGLLEYWNSIPDVIETHLVVSRDGRHWQRTARAPFIAATHDWNRTWSTCASNGPIILNEQMVFYFGGRLTSHHFDSAQQYGAIGYASLPLDRFCALEATTNGRVDLIPLEWPGGDLALNADTRESFTTHPWHVNGEITVEVLDANGAPLPEWSGENKASFRANTHCRCGIWNQLVRWPGDRSLDTLAGQTIQLRFNLQHARLFTIEAQTIQAS